MFEKEAKKWVKENTRIEHSASFGDIAVEPSAKKGFQKGAEFGYNKAKVEVEESYRESLCNSELNLASVTERLEELNKANEWHFVKNGDLPKKDCEVITLHENGNKNIIKWKNGNWTNAIVIPVIAWKEVVLPELKESE